MFSRELEILGKYMINPDFIRSYLLDVFKENSRLVSSGRELTVPSIFTDRYDRKRHLSINLETGLWQCFKTKNKGDFYRLYSIIEKKSYGRARAEITFRSFVENWDEEKESLVRSNEQLVVDEIDENGWVPLNHELATKALDYVSSRSLPASKFKYATKGLSEGRLIIPYEVDGHVIYYQGRAIDQDTFPKYYNPPQVKSSNVLYPFNEDSAYVVVTEGPLDAIALQNCGVNATSTQGCFISRNQAQMLKSFGKKIILGFDNDEAGLKGMRAFNKLRKKLMLPEFYTCLPKAGYKDWNDFTMSAKKLDNWKKQVKTHIAECSVLVDWKYDLVNL